MQLEAEHHDLMATQHIFMLHHIPTVQMPTTQISRLEFRLKCVLNEIGYANASEHVIYLIGKAAQAAGGW